MKSKRKEPRPMTTEEELRYYGPELGGPRPLTPIERAHARKQLAEERRRSKAREIGLMDH